MNDKKENVLLNIFFPPLSLQNVLVNVIFFFPPNNNSRCSIRESLESDLIRRTDLKSPKLGSFQTGTQKAIKGGGAEGQMAKRSDGRKQETPERERERDG